MEKELVWKMVQGQIEYDFKNLEFVVSKLSLVAHIP